MSEGIFAAPPDPGECAEFYHRYTSLVPPGDVLSTLRRQGDSTLALFGGLPESRHGHRYGPGKWTVWEVLRHIVDAEWVMTYRALHFARLGSGAIPGMDQDGFSAAVPAARRSMPRLLEEFRGLRAATISLFSGFDTDALGRTGIASGNTFTVRALIYIVAGHEAHHVRVVTERYL